MIGNQEWGIVFNHIVHCCFSCVYLDRQNRVRSWKDCSDFSIDAFLKITRTFDLTFISTTNIKNPQNFFLMSQSSIQPKKRKTTTTFITIDSLNESDKIFVIENDIFVHEETIALQQNDIDLQCALITPRSRAQESIYEVNSLVQLKGRTGVGRCCL